VVVGYRDQELIEVVIGDREARCQGNTIDFANC
jgi:hypothetical protein